MNMIDAYVESRRRYISSDAGQYNDTNSYLQNKLYYKENQHKNTKKDMIACQMIHNRK